jgi:hypothetical protein
MNKTFPYFLDHKNLIFTGPAMVLYVGFLPVLKLCNVIHWPWLWTLAPVWFPFLSFWLLTELVSFVVLTTEICFLVFPDEDPSQKIKKLQEKE